MQRVNNTDNSKQNTSNSRTISQNSKINKMAFSPISIFSKTEVTNKDLGFDGFQTNKNNRFRFEKFEK